MFQCIFHTFLLINYSFFSLWGAFNVVCFNTIVFLLIMSHLRAVFSDPGIVPFPDNNLDFSDMHSGLGSPIHKVLLLKD